MILSYYFKIIVREKPHWGGSVEYVCMVITSCDYFRIPLGSVIDWLRKFFWCFSTNQSKETCKASHTQYD